MRSESLSVGEGATTVRFRLGMMCDLDSSYNPRLVSEMNLPKEEAEELEQFKNENGEVVLMGRGIGGQRNYKGTSS